MSSRVLAAAIVGLSSGSAAFAQTMDVTGTCPGAIDISVTGATANGNVVFVTGTPGGSTVMAGGPCIGGTLDLGAPLAVRFNGAADAVGEKHLTPTVGAGACAFGGQWLDLTTCLTTEALSLTPTCDVPDFSWVDTAPVAPVMADPTYFAVYTTANVADGLRQDFTYDDPLGAIDAPATMWFELLDAAFGTMCVVAYDISDATSDPAYTATSALLGQVVTPTEAATATLAGGFTDCGLIDPAGGLATYWGIGDDIRDLFNGSGWGFAYNVISADLAGEIATAVTAPVYATDYDPFIIGESVIGVELNFAATYERTCQDVEVDAGGLLTLLNKPPLADVEEHGEGFPFYVFVL